MHDRLRGDQLCPDSDGCGAGQDKVGGGLLIDAAGCDQRNLGQSHVKGLDVFSPSHLSARKHLYVVGTGPPGRGHFGWRQRAGQDRDILLHRKIKNVPVEFGRGQEACSGIQAAARGVDIEDGSGAHYGF